MIHMFCLERFSLMANNKQFFLRWAVPLTAVNSQSQAVQL